MSQWDKLIERILREDSSLRFEEICKALEKIGYTCRQPRGGSSHYTFRKPGCMPITIPKSYPLNRAYIAMVDEAVRAHLEEEKK
ncbi:MAG: type II toxin-antitoxin system HicA family toxin [Clostridia bacterium]|nr:type II toxin-antitoxin system HicA family toxin [Clostridia bacterium]